MIEHCDRVNYKLEVTIARQVLPFEPKSNLENFGPFFGLDRLRNVQNAYCNAWAYRKEKIRGAETNLPDFSDFARQVPKKFSGENLF